MMKMVFGSMIVFIIFLSLSNVADGSFNCGRAMESYECLNDGTCDKDTGKCTCKSEYTGDDCSIPTATLCAEGSENPCQNGQICHGEGSCYCSHTFYGPTCEEERVQTVCKGSQFTITVAVPADFIGKIFLSTSEECEFKEIEQSFGLKRYEYQMNINETNACNNALNTSNSGDDKIYSTHALVTYSPPIISPTDLTLNIRCVHRASDVEMGSLLGAVNLDKKKNLDNQEKEKIYAPVEFRFLSEKNEPVRQLSVGEKFKLLFFLDDDSVYTSLLLMNCSANNTNKENPKVYKILENACPTRAGKNVIYFDYGQSQSKFTSPKHGTEHNAAEIMLKAFKFVDSERVAFSCGVRICKRGDEALCEIPDCAAGEKPAAAKKSNAEAQAPAAAATGDQAAESPAPPETPPGDAAAGTSADGGTAADSGTQPINEAAAPAGETGAVDTSAGVPAGDTPARRKRSAWKTEERMISGVIEVIEPIQRPQSQGNPQELEEDCFKSRDIIIVIIVMTAFIFTLLIACIVLAITVSKTRTRVNSMISDSSGPSFFIPRAKISA